MLHAITGYLNNKIRKQLRIVTVFFTLNFKKI